MSPLRFTAFIEELAARRKAGEGIGVKLLTKCQYATPVWFRCVGASTGKARSGI